jgi:GTPase
MFKRGMVIISNLEQLNKLMPSFNAEIEILHHSATIREKYSPVLHIGSIKQSAAITKIIKVIKYKDDMNEDEVSNTICLRTKDKAIVEFKFLSHHEFVEKDMIFFFREGTTRGVGKVIY